MNKAIIVFTTRYIGEKYLFSPDCTTVNSISENKYPGLESFWANRFYSVVTSLDGAKYIKEFVTPDDIKEFVAAKDLPADNINTLDDLKIMVRSEFFKYKVKALDPQSILESSSLIPVENKKVYNFKYNSEDVELYAINHLPKELSRLKLESESANDIKQLWLDAIIKSFYKEGYTLYIIMHGSTDCPSSNEPPEFIDRRALLDGIMIDEAKKDNIRVASFQHEDTARIAQLLSTVTTDVKKISCGVESCFDEYHIVGNLKKIFDSLTINANEIDKQVYSWLQEIEKYKKDDWGDYSGLDAVGLISLINNRIINKM